ncbi:hypothetical protein KIPB_004080 [Kipferlia bialata]|uniref:Uncharacterized protein n=1 Tax=Kipferlia bialata TaxID=797122 RepID=A0A9K3CTD4_9EUKA|nr:hypothetical protein KIPB_004080 [Kipferlia bialata]|eukprot:g4080.t1
MLRKLRLGQFMSNYSAREIFLVAAKSHTRHGAPALSLQDFYRLIYVVAQFVYARPAFYEALASPAERTARLVDKLIFLS